MSWRRFWERYPSENPLSGSSYIKLPNELHHSRKGLNNIENITDNECFKWCFLLDT